MTPMRTRLPRGRLLQRIRPRFCAWIELDFVLLTVLLAVWMSFCVIDRAGQFRLFLEAKQQQQQQPRRPQSNSRLASLPVAIAISFANGFVVRPHHHHHCFGNSMHSHNNIIRRTPHRHCQQSTALEALGKALEETETEPIEKSATVDLSESLSRPNQTANSNGIDNPNEDCNSVSNDACNFSKSHSLTVCLVPPPPPHADQKSTVPPNRNHERLTDESNASLWSALTRLRVELRDPGLYRWPPHINLLYPFVRYDNESTSNDGAGDIPVGVANTTETATATASTANLMPILAKLQRAARRIEPFWVTADLRGDATNTTDGDKHADIGIMNGNNSIHRGFGTFGGSNRGVLWVYPNSWRGRNGNSNITKPSDADTTTTSEPIVELQSLLEKEFPICSESLKRRNFIPHMTLSSKFDSVQDANIAAASLRNLPLFENPDGNSTVFDWWCKEFYLLERDGEHGQFRKKATIRLGNFSSDPQQLDGVFVHDPPLAFRGMPKVEEAWIVAELQALKARRKENRKNRPRGTSTTRKSYRARKRERKNAAKAANPANQQFDK